MRDRKPGFRYAPSGAGAERRGQKTARKHRAVSVRLLSINLPHNSENCVSNADLGCKNKLCHFDLN
jgi:hypothetical protein